MKRIALEDPRYYFNRHLQWLEFNRRVLEEARDKNNDAIQYVFLQDVISSHAARLYRGYDILAHASFRVTRNSNLYLEEEETRNLSIHR